ncbi:hypothetical protein BQ8794_240211 [Mesorhizobium prunaredense]|uniref:Uncharacterized protein n=1 Tax=Mesorhizobium prunaredense TaxID=1631249 RepID=A0A1R3V807_9HYPH|nr:hypothetical protein BQ8794_240211 [Mesorhizobium prunaredense]
MMMLATLAAIPLLNGLSQLGSHLYMANIMVGMAALSRTWPYPAYVPTLVGRVRLTSVVAVGQS